MLNASLAKNNQVSVDIGKAYFKWNQIPIKKKINIEEIDFKVNSLLKPFLVNVGNPHIVFFVKNLEKINLKKVGPKIEKLSLLQIFWQRRECMTNYSTFNCLSIIKYKSLDQFELISKLLKR